MAITVTPNLSEISLCESAGGGWSAGTTNDAFALQGTYCLGLKVSQAESALVTYTFGSPVPMNNGEHIFFWFQIQGVPDTQAAGGTRLYVEDSSGNYGYFNMYGSENYPGGWVCACYAPGAPYTTGSGTVNTASISKVGIRFKVLSKALGNNPNCFWDAVRYGTGLTITSGASDAINFDGIYNVDDDFNYKYGVYIVQGLLTFGGTGSENVDFTETNKIVIFPNNSFALSTFYGLKVQAGSGTTNFKLGGVTGSGSDAIGSSGVTITAPGTPAWKFTASGTTISQLKIYSSTFNKVSPAEFGTTSTVLGGSGKTIDLIDNAFTTPSQIVRNLSSSANLNQLRNKVSFASDSVASMDLYAGADTPSSEWQIIGTSSSGGKGFRSTASGTQEIDISNHNFNQMDKPYITIAADETWNSINPNWTIVTTGQTELDFLNSTSNIVNEKYTLNATVQQTDGTKLENAYTYVYEGLVNLDLPADNRQPTNTSGFATSDVLSATYVDSGGTALTKTAYGNFALKVYKYTYSPFVSSLGASLSTQVDQSVTLLDDSALSQSDQATAIASGSGITVTQSATNPNSLITFENGSGTLSATETVTGSPSGASGTVVEISDGDSSAGKVFLNSRNGTAFTNGDSLSNGGSWSADYTDNSEKRFTWEVDCATKSIQVTYDYLAAKMAEATPDSIFLDVMIWGQATESQLLYSGASGFYTKRNNSQGVFLSNRGAGTVAYFTANDGTTWAPSISTTLEVNGVKTGEEPTNYVRCYIEAITETGPEPEGTILMSEYADQSYGTEGYYKATQPYSYTIDQPVKIRARYKGYLPFEATSTIEASGLKVTAVWQVDPNFE
jgi:hypothetical protein